MRGFVAQEWPGRGPQSWGCRHGAGSELGGSGCSRGKVLAATHGLESGELAVRRLAGATARSCEFCAALPGPVRVAYEAGPTGFGLARALRRAGIGCVVAAPGKIERPAQRPRQDRPPRRRAAAAAADDRRAARGPGPDARAEEALRDLVRAREDVRGDLMRARHRVGKLLLRHDVRFEGNEPGRQRHRALAGAASISASAARRSTLLDYIGAIDALLVRRDTLEAKIATGRRTRLGADGRAAALPARHRHPHRPSGSAPRSATSSASSAPAQLMSYLGLVPSEHSSGETRRQGAITKSGSRHARRLLVEAAWHYRRRPAKGHALKPPPSRPARGARDLLERPAAPAPHLAAPGHRARQAPHDRRGRRRSRAGRLLLGGRQRRLAPGHHVGQGGGGNHPAPTRESIRDSTMSNRPGGHARS